jgi:glycosyltransferase involved in cell wall biosynthesis
MTAKRGTKLLYLVGESWSFVSHRIELAVAAKQAGYDVVVATQCGKGVEKIYEAGLRVVPISFSRSSLNPLGEMRTLASLISLYRREAPHIVHHVAVKPVIYGSLAARIAGVKGVVNALIGLGYVFSSRALKARILKPIVVGLFRFALTGPNTRLIVQNVDDFEMFAGHGIARRGDIRLIRGSGVDPSRYPVCDPRGNAVPQIVLPARMLRDKGVVEFVDAARQLKAEGVRARFVLCGEPDPLNPTSLTLSEIQAFVDSGSVEYLGWQDDMGPIWRQAQIACLPSYREGLPKALLEAAACGLPLVATDVPGCREIVRAGENGWLVPARDGKGLAGALREAIAREDLRVRYGERGRKIVETELSLAHVIEQTLKVYAELEPAR